MLHFKTIEPATLGLLKSLMELPALRETRLVGGTSLALQIGHRQSIDLDLFGNLIGEEIDLKEQIYSLGEIVIIKNIPNIHIWMVNGIKVDVVRYPFPWIGEMISLDNLRLAGLKDIAAMKLAAVTGRGSKKDFIDIFFLLKRFSLKEMVQWYSEKYKDASLFLVLKSLAYFVDADSDDEPVMVKRIVWKEIKNSIDKEVNQFIKHNDIN